MTENYKDCVTYCFVDVDGLLWEFPTIKKAVKAAEKYSADHVDFEVNIFGMTSLYFLNGQLNRQALALRLRGRGVISPAQNRFYIPASAGKEKRMKFMGNGQRIVNVLRCLASSCDVTLHHIKTGKRAWVNDENVLISCVRFMNSVGFSDVFILDLCSNQEEM